TEPSTKTSDPITVDLETRSARPETSPTESAPSASTSKSKRPHDLHVSGEGFGTEMSGLSIQMSAWLRGLVKRLTGKSNLAMNGARANRRATGPSASHRSGRRAGANRGTQQ